MTRAGFVALAGRPNVGKSTLVNTVVGEKVAITADRAQTTRRAIRGVRTEGECQIVVVDLPGVQRPRDALTARMARRVREELEGADAALLVLNGEQGVGPGDRFIAHALVESMTHPTPVTVAVNKVDRLSRAGTLEVLRGAAELGLEGEVFPISARTGEGVGELVAHLAALMPGGSLPVCRGRALRSAAAVAGGGADPGGRDQTHLSGVAPCGGGGGGGVDRPQDGQPTAGGPTGRRATEAGGHSPAASIPVSASGGSAGQGADLGGECISEGHCDRSAGADDQGDRQRRPPGTPARARLSGAPRPLGAGAPGLEGRRWPTRSPGNHVGFVKPGW